MLGGRVPMRVYLERVSWDVDADGAARATLFDDKHDCLIVGKTDSDRVTFHTDGTPSFDVNTTMEIVALSIVMARSAMRVHGETPPDHHLANRASETAGTASVSHIPRQGGARHAHEPRTHAQPG
jgi:hypothetical protein